MIQIILTAFGTAQPEALDSFHTIAKMIESRIPNSSAVWAFTSKMIRTRLLKEEITIASPEAAVKECVATNTPYVILPFQIVPGGEYENMCRVLEEISPESAKRTAAPLIAGSEDIPKIVDLLVEDFSSEALLVAGHGNGDHPSDALYEEIDRELQKRNSLFRCATLDAKPDLTEAVSFYGEKHIDKVQIIPLFFSAGKHLRNDIAGDSEDSWVSNFARAGITADVEMVPLSQKEPFINIWIEKLTTLYSMVKQ